MATNYKNFTPSLTSSKLPNTPEQKLEFFNSIDCTLSNPDDVSKITFAYESSYSAAYFSVSETVSFTTLGEKVEFMVNDSHSANQTVNYSSHTALGPSYVGTFNLSASNRYYVKKIKITIDVTVRKAFLHEGNAWLKALQLGTASVSTTSRTIQNVETDNKYPLLKKYTIPNYRIGNEGVRGWGWKKKSYGSDWDAQDWFEFGSSTTSGGMDYKFSDSSTAEKRRENWNFTDRCPRILYDNLGVSEFVPITFVMSSRSFVKLYFTRKFWPGSSRPTDWFKSQDPDMRWDFSSNTYSPDGVLYLGLIKPKAASVTSDIRGGFTKSTISGQGHHGWDGTAWSPIANTPSTYKSDWSAVPWKDQSATMTNTENDIEFINFKDVLQTLYDTYFNSGDSEIVIYCTRSSITIYHTEFRSPYVEGTRFKSNTNTYYWSSLDSYTRITDEKFSDLFEKKTYGESSWSITWGGNWNKYQKIGQVGNKTYYGVGYLAKNTIKFNYKFTFYRAIDNNSWWPLVYWCSGTRDIQPGKEGKDSPHYGGFYMECVVTHSFPAAFHTSRFVNCIKDPYQYNWDPRTANSNNPTSVTWYSSEAYDNYKISTQFTNIPDHSGSKHYCTNYTHVYSVESGSHKFHMSLGYLMGMYGTTDVGWRDSLTSASSNPLTVANTAPLVAVMYTADSTSTPRYSHWNHTIVLVRQKSGDTWLNTWKMDYSTNNWPVQFTRNSETTKHDFVYTGTISVNSGDTITFYFKNGYSKSVSYSTLVSATSVWPYGAWISCNG